MINASNLLVCSASHGKSTDADRITANKSFVDSATKQGITVQMFWTGQPDEGYLTSKLVNLRDNLVASDARYTHVLYVDPQDVLFLTPLNEIIQAYDSLGDPNFIMMGDSTQDPRNVDLKLNNNISGYRFPNDGCFMGRKTTIINSLSTIITRAGANTKINPKVIFRTLMSEGTLTNSHIDSNCALFQSVVSASYSDLALDSGRIKNEATNSFPKIIRADHATHHPAFQRIYEFAVNDDNSGLSSPPSYLVGIEGTPNLKNANDGNFYLRWDVGDPRAMLILTRKQAQALLRRNMDIVNIQRTNNNPFLRVWLENENPNIRINVTVANTNESFTVPNTANLIAVRANIAYDTTNDRVTSITLRWFDEDRNLLYQRRGNVNLAISNDSAYFTKNKGTIIT